MAERVHKVTEVHDDTERPSVGGMVLLARLIYFIFGVIIAFLLLRVVLLLLGANQGNAFVDFIYTVSGVFAAPFFGMFGYTPAYGTSVFEISTFIAIIIYMLICWGLVALVTMGSRHRGEV